MIFPLQKRFCRKWDWMNRVIRKCSTPKNVLRRIQKYMPYRTGATIKLTVAQTDPRVPEIVTEELQAVYLYNGVSRSGKPLNYTKTKNPLAGGHWDRALVAAEGDALAADLERYIGKRSGE